MTAEEIRDHVRQWIRNHRAHCPDPPCVEPANFLAFLAHCAGLRRDQVGEFADCLAKYEATCEGC